MEQSLQDKMDQWRAEKALENIGLESYGPNLIGLSLSVLKAIDDAGDDVDSERVAAIVDAHVGPEAICPDCVYAAVRESDELMFTATPVVEAAESFDEALGLTLFLPISMIAANEWQAKEAAQKAARKAKEAAMATGETDV